MINILCFSKDRLFQLSEYIRTLKKYCIEHKLTVLYYPHYYYSSIQTLINKYPDVDFVKEENFEQQVRDYINNCSTDLIMFGVDDLLFYDFVPSYTIVFLLEENVFSFHSRFNPYINYSFSCNKKCPPPACTYVSKDIRQFNNQEAELNSEWNYPFELVGAIYKTKHIQDLIKLVKFKNPNELEGNINSIVRDYINKNKLNYSWFPASQIATVITVNRVQETYQNRIYKEIKPEVLNLLYGLFQFNEEYYRNQIFNSPHIGEVSLINIR